MFSPLSIAKRTRLFCSYQLNAAVDSQLASQRPPLAIMSMTAPFYAPVADSISSISRYIPAILGGGGGNDIRSGNRPGFFRLPSGIEVSNWPLGIKALKIKGILQMIGPNGEEKLQGSRGERRFSALNPHGNVDFFLPSAGVNEYLGEISPRPRDTENRNTAPNKHRRHVDCASFVLDRLFFCGISPNWDIFYPIRSNENWDGLSKSTTAWKWCEYLTSIK